MNRKFVCCICGKEVDEYGNNPFPVKDTGKCCNKCNIEKVIPMRISLLISKEEEER